MAPVALMLGRSRTERLDRDAGADVVAFARDRLDRHRTRRERPEHPGIAVAPSARKVKVPPSLAEAP
jgi:hypothetical protein